MEDLQTEYDYSSDIEGIFSEPKSEKKTDRNLSQTSLQFASIRSEREKEKTKAQDRSHGETENGDLYKHELITWAAKLELESLTLKDILHGNLGHIFKQNYNFLRTISEELTQRMCRVESSVLGIEHQLEESENAQKDLDMLNEKVAAMTEKIEQVTEKDRKNDRENIKGTKRQIEAGEKNLAKLSVEELLKHKDFKEHLSLLREIHRRLDFIDEENKARTSESIKKAERNTEEKFYSELSECFLKRLEDVTYKSIVPAIQEKVGKEIEMTLSNLLQKIMEKSMDKWKIELKKKGSQAAIEGISNFDSDNKFTKENPSTVWMDSRGNNLGDEIKSVQSFLKLLLPRVVGLESRYKELASHFNSLVDIYGKPGSEYLAKKEKPEVDTEKTNYENTQDEYCSKRRKREAG